jgi:hypothetical protein
MFDGEEPSSDKLNRAMQVLRAFLRTKERSVPEKPVGESSRPIFSVQKASFDMLTPIIYLRTNRDDTLYSGARAKGLAYI